VHARKVELRQRVKVASHSRKKPGRKALSPDLPRIEIHHDLTPEEKQCDCGAELVKIGDDIRERLDVIPAKIQVEKHIYPKYACKKCRGLDMDGASIKTAPAAQFLLKKSNVSNGFLAHVIISKFCDHLPLNRQESIFSRYGIDLGRSSLSGQVLLGGKILETRIRDIYLEELMKYPLLQIDETPLKVLRFDNIKGVKNAYMWLFRGHGERPLLWFEYRPGRSGDFLNDILADYKGKILTDGYSPYETFCKSKNLDHLLCNAHSRRNYFDASKGLHEHQLAEEGLRYYRALYHVEALLKQSRAGPEKILHSRRKYSGKIFSLFKKWLLHNQKEVLPSSKIHEAILYTLNHWDGLTEYLKHPGAPIDNNLAEAAIRPFAIGRKNWLFAGSPRGAAASAIFYSLVESAKANGLEPYWYLRYLFNQLSTIRPKDEILNLLPHRIDPKSLMA